MKLIIARILISAVSVLILSLLLKGIHVKGNLDAVLVAGLLAILNATLRPVLILLTLPVSVVTLGLFLFVINALIILLASRWLPGFTVDGFWWALLFSFLLSVFNSIFQNLLLKGHE